jgi:CheY-like chemotaxis protein/HPt (histidine-containing phosphotransfer) domain-containing protein
MPEMDGGTLAARIKSDATIKNTTLVMLTSMGQGFTASKMRATGLAALLHKPVRQSVLLETLNKVWAVYSGKSPAGKSGDQLVFNTVNPAAKPVIDSAALGTMKVLLVEDNEVNREVAIGMLETLGCQIEVAMDGREGLNRVIRERFDAVLMDCHMPVMDGYEATGEIRRIEQVSKARRIPIIAMTANAMKGDREKCIDAGMDDYVTKPIRMTVLAEILSKYAPDATKSAAISNHAARAVKTNAEPSAPQHPVFDYSAALNTASGKPERLKRIVCAFMADAPRRIDALTNALLSGDSLVAEREAHSLRGAAANLAAERFRTHAYEAERACKSGDLPMAEKIVPMLAADFNELIKELKPLAC